MIAVSWAIFEVDLHMIVWRTNLAEAVPIADQFVATGAPAPYKTSFIGYIILEQMNSDCSTLFEAALFVYWCSTFGIYKKGTKLQAASRR